MGDQKLIAMFDAKEQAKYYIDKIRSVGRSTNQALLLVFIPLFFLYLTQIEQGYVFAENCWKKVTGTFPWKIIVVFHEGNEGFPLFKERVEGIALGWITLREFINKGKYSIRM